MANTAALGWHAAPATPPLPLQRRPCPCRSNVRDVEQILSRGSVEVNGRRYTAHPMPMLDNYSWEAAERRWGTGGVSAPALLAGAAVVLPAQRLSNSAAGAMPAQRLGNSASVAWSPGHVQP